MAVTIYYNPSCCTSRNTLAMIGQSGEELEVIEYLKTPPTRERLISRLCRPSEVALEILSNPEIGTRKRTARLSTPGRTVPRNDRRPEESKTRGGMQLPPRRPSFVRIRCAV